MTKKKDLILSSSAHIATSKNSAVVHNARENFSHSVVFTDEKNELWNNSKEAFEIYRQELEKRAKAYTDRTNQRLQKNTSTKLSVVVNLLKHHTLEDLVPIKKFLEKRLDTKVFQMAIHRDEGKLISKDDETELYSGKDFFKSPKNDELYYDKKYTKKIDLSKYIIKKNYHAHLEMLGIDSTGAAIRHNKMHKHFLKELQDITAQTLKMERTYGNKKRLDTHQFKEVGQAREQQKRATQKQLKEEIAKLKEELKLKESNARRKDYIALEQQNAIIAKLKAENAKREKEAKKAQETIEQLMATLEMQKSVIEDLKQTKNDLKAKYEELKSKTDTEIDEIWERAIKDAEKAKKRRSLKMR